jgi:Protein of unknown function (DUF4242)
VSATYLVECYWPGLTREIVEAVDARARAQAAEQVPPAIRYLGSVLVPGDEVVFFEFEASSPEEVARASADAGIPFDRVVESVRVTPVEEVRGGSV